MEIKKRKLLLFFGDLILLYLSLFLALFFRRPQSFTFEFYKQHLLPFSLIYLFWVISFYVFGLYDLEPLKATFYLKSISAISLGFIFGVLCFYFLPFLKITPKTVLILDILFFSFFFIRWRKIYFSLFSTYLQKKVVIFGEGEEVEKLKKEIKEKPYLGYQLVEIDLEKNILEQIQKEKIGTVIFTEEFEKNPKFLTIFYSAIPLGISFLDFALAVEQILEKIPISQISKAWFLENLKEENKKIYEKLKRAFDFFFSLFVLILSLPIWPFVALAIKLEDGGPIFYIQERIGKNGKIFKLMKFRSMVPEAEKIGPKWTEEKDQRITKVGKILRKIHFDEMPQMINILKGEMSFVGPRPQRIEFVKEFEKEIPHYNLRHIIKPGFTGWGQIKFKAPASPKDFAEQFQYDLYYIKNRSFLLDLRILLKTLQLFFKK